MVIDSNKSRHGKRFVGVPVVSFETALKSAPDDLEIFILEGKFTNEVLGYLHEKHFPPERIINYEPVVKAACCPLADANLVMSGNALFSCCSEDGKLIPPRVENNGDIREALTEFISMRKGLLNSISEGRFSSCTGCHEIKNSFHPLHPRIRTLSYGDGGVCNFKCSYCITGASGAKGSYDRDIDLSEALRALKEMGAPLENMMLEFGPGEPTLHRERERYYKAMSEVGTVLVLTNGSVFDAALAERMSKGGFSICVSIDAGTRETYKKIKGVDCLERTIQNLKKYNDMAPGAVQPKYIFLPGINDNPADVDGFIRICDEIKPEIVDFSYDAYLPDQILSEKTFAMVKYMVARLEERSMIYKNLSTAISNAYRGILQ